MNSQIQSPSLEHPKLRSLSEVEKDRDAKIATPEFLSAARLADRYAGERGSKQYKAAAAVIQLLLDGKPARICPRCSGAGGFQWWPGFTCHKCNGDGYTA